MTRTVKTEPKRKRRPARTAGPQFILLNLPASWRKHFEKTRFVACSSQDEIHAAIMKATKDSLWISPDPDTTDKLLRTLIVQLASPSGTRLRLGDIIMLRPPRRQALSVLVSYFRQVIGENPSSRMLPHDQLATVLSAPEDESGDVFIEGLVDSDSDTLVLVRGNRERMTVPLSIFRPSATSRPDFGRFELDDFGHTLRLGDYEAAADAVLYEVDPDFRRRTNARRRSSERGFGPGLRRLRIQRGLPREGFPGISAKTIARLERGEVARPRGKTLQAIASALGVEPDSIEEY